MLSDYLLIKNKKINYVNLFNFKFFIIFNRKLGLFLHQKNFIFVLICLEIILLSVIFYL